MLPRTLLPRGSEPVGIVVKEGGALTSVTDPGVIEYGGRHIWVRPDGTQTARLAALADAGTLTVAIAKTYGLDEVADAYRASATGHTQGKLVIKP